MRDLGILLSQIVVVCTAARLLGWVAEKLHQPRVVGEILAGILLGPTFLGWLSASLFSSLFPPTKLQPLYFLSQIGLLLFMFQVGLELDFHALRKLGPAVVFTSNVSVLLPLAAGAGLGVYLHPTLAGTNISLLPFAFFLGTAMSVTAFPVLARVLDERNLLQTNFGMVAISCAAVDDITAWCLLALLVASVRSGAGTAAWLTLAGLGVYLLIMTCLVRPFLAQLNFLSKKLSRQVLAFTLLFVFLSAWATERIGIHALFGAFFAGVVMPQNKGLSNSIQKNLELVIRVFLLPLFFAFTGLRASIHLLNDGRLWFICFLIIVVAVAGKLLGCTVSARIGGMGFRDAFSVGILMNTRGMIELVILNVGLDLGVISQTLFSMMVFMALITTFMTTPLLSLVNPNPATRSRALVVFNRRL